MSTKAKRRGFAIGLPVVVPLIWAVFYNQLVFNSDALVYGLLAAPVIFGLYLLLPTLKDRTSMIWVATLYLILGAALSWYILLVGVCAIHNRCF